MNLINRLKKTSIFWLLLASLLLGAFVELVGFQLDDILLKVNGPERVELDLSTLEGYDGSAIPVLPETATYSFNGLHLPTKSVTITLGGPIQTLSGTVSICDEANAWQTVGAGHFLVNPGGNENTFTVRINSHGNLSRLRISFEELEEPVFITSVVFNQAQVDVSWLRVLVFAGICWLILLVLKYEIYAQTLDLKKRSHKWLSLSALLFCLAFAFLFFYKCAPDHSYLQPMPSNEELGAYQNTDLISDAYAEQLDAFEKGQIQLDLAVNPALEELDNVYDRGERIKKNVEYHWDRAYYDGAYYSYFGLAPLFMIYYPVYWLTGMVPTALLCLSVLAVFAMVGTYFALHGLLKFFRLRANLLLYLLGIPAVMGGGMLYMLQTNDSFYYYPVLCGLGWLTVFLGCSFYACSNIVSCNVGGTAGRGFQKWVPSLLFFCAGLSVVMLVLSRPNLALLAVVFVAPAFLHILLDRKSSLKSFQVKASAAVPFLVPVIVGAVGICWYNYVRFGSITEFGTSYQLTESDIRYNSLTLSFHHLKAMLYHYFLEPLRWQEFFPFFDLSWTSCYDYGNYLYYECNGGLLNLPLNLGIFLVGWTCFSKTKKAPQQKATYALVVLGILALGYLDFTMGGIHIRYVCDLALVVAMLSLLLILEHVSFSNVKSGQILYAVVVVMLLATIVLGFLLGFANESNVLLEKNPDFYIQAANFLQNW